MWLQLNIPFKRVNKLQIVLRFCPIFNSVLLRQCPTRESLLLYCDTLIIASINFAPARRIFNHNIELEPREIYFSFLALSCRGISGIVSAVFIFMLNQPHLSIFSIELKPDYVPLLRTLFSVSSIQIKAENGKSNGWL